MKRIIITLVVSLVIIPGMVREAPAKIESEVQKTLNLPGLPLDLAVSADGNQVFILLKGGEILIYSGGGELRERLKVDPDADRMEISPSGTQLYISSSKGKTLRLVSIETVHEINATGSPFLGPANAPVEVIVFSDFQCPYCARLGPLLQQVRELFPQEVKIVFKQFPLSMHQFARKAAAASLAAEEQGKFWEFHDRLFANFNRLNDEKIREIAVEAGLDMARFEKSLADPKIGGQIDQDIRDGLAAGVRGTPTVFIDGKLLRDRSLQGFREMIEKDLGKTKAPSK